MPSNQILLRHNRIHSFEGDNKKRYHVVFCDNRKATCNNGGIGWKIIERILVSLLPFIMRLMSI